MSKDQKKKEDGFEQLEDALTYSEQFIEKNQKMLMNVVLGLLAVICIYFGYDKFIAEPQATEAANQIFGAQNYFEKDSFNLALNGDGNVLGFVEIADKYSSTPSGNLANLYAGLSYLYTNDYENAIKYLQKFSSDDFLLANMATANIGDAYMQLGNYKKAAEYYQKAGSSKTNDFSTPVFLMKQGMALEKNNNYKEAVRVYEKIEKEYPASVEARDIEKYIERAKLKNNGN
ncbi:MAG: tetratricopeptide repeat protein [Odoribacter sp.]|nr:tetratricopeptide repeat protein [Odoribacter sp.]